MSHKAKSANLNDFLIITNDLKSRKSIITVVLKVIQIVLIFKEIFN